MKKMILLFALLLLAWLQYSCSEKHVAKHDKVPVKLNIDSVKAALAYRFYVSEAYRHIGKDSVNLFEVDTVLRIFQRGVFLQIRVSEGYVNFWSGKPIPNTEMPGNALTFGLNVRIEQPTGLEVHWDEQKGTVVVESKRTGYYLPMVIPGKTGYLDPESFRMYRSYPEARDAVIKPSMKFIYEDQDPKLGKVTYKVTLKPAYEYYRDPNQQVYAKFVVF
ncbi:hypothetical protein [Dyadobacter sp. MSC1_007]|jgi:hypothetical protein|uniref:hypothetical protein n=1 Tax=Dyadobacter sp. MSC1_007 TaxID=2909264 RepID=UPI00202F12BC|nr:hypothetical protein [Dyadobacter sp. MSC1_007]